MNDRRNAQLTPNAQKLRSGMTKEERHLWYDFLKKLPVTVNRQKVLGPYIADFYCGSASLVIELDGSQHYEAEGRTADEKRDLWLSEQGFKVLRFSNAEVNQSFNAVCDEILRHIYVEG